MHPRPETVTDYNRLIDRITDYNRREEREKTTKLHVLDNNQ